MVEGLQAAADMNDTIAAMNERSAENKRALGDDVAAKQFEKAAEALRNASVAIRARAAEEITGRFRAVNDPGPGWMKRRRTRSSMAALPTAPLALGDTTEVTKARPRRRRKGSSWWRKLKFW